MKPYPVFLFSLPSDYLASSIRGRLICCFQVTFCDFYTKPAYFVIPIYLKEAKILNISSIDNKNRRVPVLFDLKLCMQLILLKKMFLSVVINRAFPKLFVLREL